MQRIGHKGHRFAPRPCSQCLYQFYSYRKSPFGGRESPTEKFPVESENSGFGRIFFPPTLGNCLPFQGNFNLAPSAQETEIAPYFLYQCERCQWRFQLHHRRVAPGDITFFVPSASAAMYDFSGWRYTYIAVLEWSSFGVLRRLRSGRVRCVWMRLFMTVPMTPSPFWSFQHSPILGISPPPWRSSSFALIACGFVDKKDIRGWSHTPP